MNMTEPTDHPTCPTCHQQFRACTCGCQRLYCDCVTPDVCDGLMTDAQVQAELAEPERVSGLRTRLERGGYKSIWQTETINHAGDRTVISSWVRKEVPTDKARMWPKAYKASIYEDVLLVERYEGVDGIHPGEYCGSSTYIHGVEPDLTGRTLRLDGIEDPDAHEKAAQAVEEEGKQ